MKKQKSLFDGIEPKTKKRKKKEKKPTNLVANQSKSDSIVSNIIDDVKIKKEIKKNPKTELFTCECGLKIHWEIAEARKACPQCNKKIDPKEIFEYISE